MSIYGEVTPRSAYSTEREALSLSKLFKQSLNGVSQRELFEQVAAQVDLMAKSVRSILTAKCALSMKANGSSQFEQNLVNGALSKFQQEAQEYRKKLRRVTSEVQGSLDYNSDWQQSLLDCIDSLEPANSAVWFSQTSVQELSDITNFLLSTQGSASAEDFSRNRTAGAGAMVLGQREENMKYINVLPPNGTGGNGLLLKILMDGPDTQRESMRPNADLNSITKVERVVSKHNLSLAGAEEDRLRRNPNRTAVYLRRNPASRSPLTNPPQDRPEETALNDPELRQILEHRKRTNNRLTPLKKTQMTESSQTESFGLILPKVEKAKTSKYDILEQRVYGEDEVKRRRVASPQTELLPPVAEARKRRSPRRSQRVRHRQPDPVLQQLRNPHHRHQPAYPPITRQNAHLRRPRLPQPSLALRRRRNRGHRLHQVPGPGAESEHRQQDLLQDQRRRQSDLPAGRHEQHRSHGHHRPDPQDQAQRKRRHRRQ